MPKNLPIILPLSLRSKDLDRDENERMYQMKDADSNSPIYRKYPIQDDEKILVMVASDHEAVMDIIGENELLQESRKKEAFYKSDRFKQSLAQEYDEEYSETSVEYIDQMTRLGDPKLGKRIWILIGIYHEEDGFNLKKLEKRNINNDITAIIFANSLKEAKKLLRTHPVYIKDIEECKASNSDDEDLYKVDVVQFIFDDLGQKLAQLCGSFCEVPEKFHHYFR